MLQGHGAEARVRAAQDRLRMLEAEESEAVASADSADDDMDENDENESVGVVCSNTLAFRAPPWCELRHHAEHARGVVVRRGDDGFEIRRGREVQDAAHVAVLHGLTRRRPRVPQTHGAVDAGAA